MQGKWTHITGNQVRGTFTNYSMPYPGGLYDHTMVFDDTNHCLYIFGGNGNDANNFGILFY